MKKYELTGKTLAVFCRILHRIRGTELLIQCKDCGLFYMPTIGHLCKAGKGQTNENA